MVSSVAGESEYCQLPPWLLILILQLWSTMWENGNLKLSKVRDLSDKSVRSLYSNKRPLYKLGHVRFCAWGSWQINPRFSPFAASLAQAKSTFSHVLCLQFETDPRSPPEAIQVYFVSPDSSWYMESFAGISLAVTCTISYWTVILHYFYYHFCILHRAIYLGGNSTCGKDQTIEDCAGPNLHLFAQGPATVPWQSSLSNTHTGLCGHMDPTLPTQLELGFAGLVLVFL